MLRFNKEIKVGEKTISNEKPVFIIAEAGVNHGGDMALAKKLIDVASKAGVDAVKFQTFKTEHLILQGVEKAPYQQETTAKSESQFEMLKKLEVTREQNLELQAYCKKMGVLFLTTPFEEESLEELDELHLPAYKIASTDTTNIPFLKKVAAKGKPIFLSTGMTYMSELEVVLKDLHKINKDIVLLQCTANYPIIDEEANLNVLYSFKEKFDMILGYSDHTVGVGAAPYAIPMGAKVVEKHFTIDKSLEGPDHKASLSPEELLDFVKEVRKVEKFLGLYEKLPTISESKTRKSLQKCFVAKTDILAGSAFGEDNLCTKRTGGIGISPLYYDVVCGQKAKKTFKKNDIIEL
ncbi:MAG: N-acetylneuraminate synthase family protein [Bacteroidetes bacterium]|nr:N-acetylneuraminate synthase family protein [Bacteroidota bacterium]